MISVAGGWAKIMEEKKTEKPIKLHRKIGDFFLASLIIIVVACIYWEKCFPKPLVKVIKKLKKMD